MEIISELHRDVRLAPNLQLVSLTDTIRLSLCDRITEPTKPGDRLLFSDIEREWSPLQWTAKMHRHGPEIRNKSKS